jgi:hypothetical protein
MRRAGRNHLGRHPYDDRAFPTEAEAQKELDIWTAEGQREPIAIKVVPLYSTAEEWHAADG